MTWQFLKARHCSVISVDNTTLPETFRARKWYTLHFPLHERFHGCLCFRVEQYLMWLWSWCVLGLTDQIRSLRQVTSHVTVETAVDPNLPLHSSRAKQTYSNRMLGWEQDTQKSTLTPKMMNSSSVSVNTCPWLKLIPSKPTSNTHGV